jgi:uncharacterized protein
MAVVVFDHPGFGASQGTPRQEVNPDFQLRAYRDAISYAQGLEGIDGDRVGVWGTSFSGGHAIVIAATDTRVRCAVAQIPYVCPPAVDVPSDLMLVLQQDEEQRRRGGDPLMIPVTTDSTEGFGALSPDPDSYAWFGAMALEAPTWRNEVTLTSIARLFLYRPIDSAPELHAPVLIIAATDDVLSPLKFIELAYEAMPDTCELVELEGGHFDMYGEHFGLSSQAAVGWFSRWLAPE